MTGTSTLGTTGTGGGSGITSASSDPTSTVPVYDMGSGPGLHQIKVGEDECPFTAKEACDIDVEDPASALGLGCERGVIPTEFSSDGHVDSMVVRKGGFGDAGDLFPPAEGARFVILSTGRAVELGMTREEIELASQCPADDALCPSTDFGPAHRAEVLPMPILPNPVEEGGSCTADMTLVGTGDCSNTILEQWSSGDGELYAHDYAELRFSTLVAADATHIGFSFAFFSAEYPARMVTGHNDLFIAWIESERWTGNIALDAQKNPIAVDVVRLNYMDAVHPELCDEPCESPELEPFGMRGHAATGWIEQAIGVTPGDEVELVFALWDVGDANVDSAVLLDDVHWECAVPG